MAVTRLRGSPTLSRVAGDTDLVRSPTPLPVARLHRGRGTGHRFPHCQQAQLPRGRRSGRRERVHLQPRARSSAVSGAGCLISRNLIVPSQARGARFAAVRSRTSRESRRPTSRSRFAARASSSFEPGRSVATRTTGISRRICGRSAWPSNWRQAEPVS